MLVEVCVLEERRISTTTQSKPQPNTKNPNIKTQIVDLSAHWENPWGVDPGSRSAVHPIYIDLPPSAPDPLLSAQPGSTSIHIFFRAFFWIVERPNLFKILFDHST